MDANTLALIAGTFLSLVFSYVPKFNEWFAGKGTATKQLVMLGLLVLSTAAIYGMSCLGWTFGAFEVTCDQAGIKQLVEVLVVAIIANQSIFAISPETKKVQEAKKLSAE